MHDERYQLLGVGPGSQIAGAFKVVRQRGSDSLSADLEVYNRDGSEIVLLRLFHPEATKPPEDMRPMLEDLGKARSLSHDALLPILEISKTEKDELFLIHPLAEHHTLAFDFESHPGTPYSVEECVYILLRIARALAAGKRVGIHHLHLSPREILLEPGGSVRLRGLGLGRIFRGPLGKDTSEYATRYAAAEQLAGQLGGEQSDLYSLGVIAYQMLLGRHPGKANEAAPEKLAEANRRDPNRWLAELIDQLLEREQDKQALNLESLVRQLEEHAPPEDLAQGEYLKARQERKHSKPRRQLPEMQFQIPMKWVLGTALIVFLLIGLRQLGLSNRRNLGLDGVDPNLGLAAQETNGPKFVSPLKVMKLPGLAQQSFAAVGQLLQGEFIQQSADGRTTYFNTSLKFAISAPPGWKVNSQNKAGNSLVTFSSPENRTPQETPDVVVGIQRLNQGQSMLQRAQAEEQAFLKEFSSVGAEILEPLTSTQVGRYRALSTVYTVADAPRKPVYHSFYLELKPSLAAVVVFSHPKGDSKRFTDHHAEILTSLREPSNQEIDELVAKASKQAKDSQQAINEIFDR